MDDKPSTALQKACEELKAGNPIIILVVLLVLVTLGSCWVWQTTHNPVVNTPTPRFSHPSAVAPLVVLTAQASSTIPPARASVTPPPATATPTHTHTLTDLVISAPKKPSRCRLRSPCLPD